MISELKQIFGDDFDYKANLLSQWCGIRPLVIETEEDKNRKASYLKIETDPKKMNMLQYFSSKFKNSVISLGRVIHSVN